MSTEVLHHIKASLYPNKLTNEPNTYVARASSERSLGIREICQTAVTRGGATGSANAMEQNVRDFLKEWAYQLCDGYSVNTGYFTASVRIKGVFGNTLETFDAAKHKVLFQIQQGDLLRKMRKDIKVDIMGLADVLPAITQVRDMNSGAVNDTLTPGKVLKISGNKIKVMGDHPDTGVFFVSETMQRFSVPANDLISNTPNELLTMIPNLMPGNYRLEVVTQFGGSTLLHTPRVATFDVPLMTA